MVCQLVISTILPDDSTYMMEIASGSVFNFCFAGGPQLSSAVKRSKKLFQAFL